MPTRNSVKAYTPDSFYHLYTRGVNKQAIFRDDVDKILFLSLLKRYLSAEKTRHPKHATYTSYADTVDLLAYCLMDNHIHLLVYLYDDTEAITGLMRRVMTTYSVYFNKKYDRLGPLFQSRYLASPIDSDAYLHHISRYIHRNPKMWSEYTYSSLHYYMSEAHADWVKPSRILELFDNDSQRYFEFVASMDDDDEETIATILAHE